MAAPLLVRNRNYRLLFASGALTNLGDGLVALALPWLATVLTRDPVAIAAVAAASRLPWLIFSLPAGVVADQVDRRKLIARADLLRAALVGAILWLALGATNAAHDNTAPIHAASVWILVVLAFLLGAAEVLRDNAAQTILPDIVHSEDLEAANGQMWSIEQLTGQFVGPPLAGLLIAASIALPFGLDVAALVAAAGLVWLISLAPRPAISHDFRTALKEGITFMRRDALLLRLAIVLGCANFLAMGTMTVQVLFAQDVLGLTAAQYGFVLSVAALGAITGSLAAPRLTRHLGTQTCLLLSIGGWAVGYASIGVTSSAISMAVALFGVMACAMLWNVITVSWRQRRIPTELLGRVNSIYRFFGWGSMPLGALAAGTLVAQLTAPLGVETALRAPFLLAATLCLCLLAYAWLRLRLD